MSDNTQDTTPRPVAFMVMPFRERTVPPPSEGAPVKVDCDALWDRAFRPALEELGYMAIRADMEIGSVIVKDMLERLCYADLVVADLTLPNGNVYYEVGLRHVAKETHCVLIAAEWSKQLFDVDQFRTDRYPLKDGKVPEDEAGVIKNFLKEVVEKKRDVKTPYHEYISGDKRDSTVFRDQIEKIHTFQAEVRTARLTIEKEAKKQQVQELFKRFTNATVKIPEVALELFTLVRDILGWEELLKYEKTLSADLQERPFVKEQVLLAKSKQKHGSHAEAIAGLEELMKQFGESAERWGLFGGRYKRLYREERDRRQESGEEMQNLQELGYLDEAIEAYKKGMVLDYNEYFCASNLPTLLRDRGENGDVEEAEFLDKLIKRICERKTRRSEDDGWVKATLLGVAFRSQDITLVRKLAIRVNKQGAAAWELETSLDDIDDALYHVKDQTLKSSLTNVRDNLYKLVEKA
jgi:tetratricopeptide (TPR) repeat protein